MISCLWIFTEKFDPRHNGNSTQINAEKTGLTLTKRIHKEREDNLLFGFYPQASKSA